MVHRPRNYTFEDLEPVGPYQVQRVLIEDMQGRFYMAEYAMIQTQEGWKIDGVQILPTEDVGA